MDLNAAMKNLLFDTRMKDWNLKQGVVTKEEIDANLKALKDSKQECEPITLEDRDSEIL